MDEVSTPGDSAGNGFAERAILTVEGLVRTTRAVVEENVLEGRVAGPHLTAWMVHHAAQVICACMVGADGATPSRRRKGAQVRLANFHILVTWLASFRPSSVVSICCPTNFVVSMEVRYPPCSHLQSVSSFGPSQTAASQQSPLNLRSTKGSATEYFSKSPIFTGS